MLIFNNLAVNKRLQPCQGELKVGDQVHIIGPNGAGKSTLLAVLAGSLIPSQGCVLWQDKPLIAYHSRVLAKLRAYLPQQQTISCIIPVFHYLSLHIVSKVSPLILDNVINFLAEKFGMQNQLSKPISKLSGGQWQKVRLMSVILQIWPELNPYGRLLILDEPFTGLDIDQQRLFAQLFNWLCQHGIIVILSSHDLNQTLHHADEVILMQEGSIVAKGNAKDIIVPEKLTTVYNTNFQRFQHNELYWIIAEV